MPFVPVGYGNISKSKKFQIQMASQLNGQYARLVINLRSDTICGVRYNISNQYGTAKVLFYDGFIIVINAKDRRRIKGARITPKYIDVRRINKYINRYQ